MSKHKKRRPDELWWSLIFLAFITIELTILV